MSSVNWPTTDSRSLRPRAFTPSSLVIRIRIQPAMRDVPLRRNREPSPSKMRHIRNSLAICSLGTCQFLLTLRRLTIARVGMAGLTGQVPLKSVQIASGCTGGPAAAGGGVWDVRGRETAGMCAGGTSMATALVDLYGGEDFEPFDRII